MAIVDAVCLQTRLRKRVYTVKYAHRILLYPLYSQSCVELLKLSSGLQNREVVGKTLDATPSKCLDKHLRELRHSLTLVSQTFSRVLVKTYGRSSLRQILFLARQQRLQYVSS